MTLATPNQRALAKARTREKILAAGQSLFDSLGYEHATIRDIAQAAGMSTGAVFACFDDKAQLFRAIFQKEVEGAADLIGKTLSQHEDPLEALSAFALALYQLGEGRLGLVRAAMSLNWNGDPGSRAQLIASAGPLQTIVIDLISRCKSNSLILNDTSEESLTAMFWTMVLSGFGTGLDGDASVEKMYRRFKAQFDLVELGMRQHAA